MLKPLVFACLAVILPAASQAADYRDRSVPMRVVADLDLNKYLGKWYEIARFPNRFEKGCQGVTAEYSLRDDGKVRVLNTCRKGSPTGPAEQAEGQASVVGPGQLSVTFVPWLPFAKGDYWVLYVDAGYTFAVVGEPKGRTGWVLAREKVLSTRDYEKALNVLAENGYDVSKLTRVAQ